MMVEFKLFTFLEFQDSRFPQNIELRFSDMSLVPVPAERNFEQTPPHLSPLWLSSLSSNEDKPDDEDTSIDSSDEETEEEVEEETKEDKQSTKLSPYHAQNYFNSTMGGKDLLVLFAMVVGCSSHEFPDHKDPPFSKSKAYHSEVKPDATLKLEVKWHWKVYFSTTHQPCTTNWKIDKCHEYLLSHPIPMWEKADLDFLSLRLRNGKAYS